MSEASPEAAMAFFCCARIDRETASARDRRCPLSEIVAKGHLDAVGPADTAPYRVVAVRSLRREPGDSSAEQEIQGVIVYG